MMNKKTPKRRKRLFHALRNSPVRYSLYISRHFFLIKHPHINRNDRLLSWPTIRLEKLLSPFHKIWFHSIRAPRFGADANYGMFILWTIRQSLNIRPKPYEHVKNYTAVLSKWRIFQMHAPLSTWRPNQTKSFKIYLFVLKMYLVFIVDIKSLF
jgi:hypothetical protein